MSNARVSAKDLERIRLADREWMENYKARGGLTTTYKCQHCSQDIEIAKPKQGDVGQRGYWDSMRTCTACGKLNFVFVWPDGRTEINKC